MAEPQRLQKVLSQAGIASRRVAEEMIADGRVRINQRVAALGDRADPAIDQITIDGIPLPVAEGLVHYLVNKPVGVICTLNDPQSRPLITSLVPSEPRVVPVGRLDINTEGLIILTNDGTLTYALTHPSKGVPKEYLAHVQGVPSRGALRQLRQGVELDDGLTAPADEVSAQGSVIRLVIHEGRKRQVRRMCEAVGHPVLRLVRTRIGPISDRRIAPGDFRRLEIGEVIDLYAAAGLGDR